MFSFSLSYGVGIFDTRKGSTPVEQSLIENSHRDPAYKAIWLQSKSGTEFFSGSTDGKVKDKQTIRFFIKNEIVVLDPLVGYEEVIGACRNSDLRYREKRSIGTCTRCHVIRIRIDYCTNNFLLS